VVGLQHEWEHNVMLDSAQGSSLKVVSLMDPVVIATATTTVSASGYWVDMTQFEGYVLFVVSLGTLTDTSVAVQLESSASSTGSSPASGGASALFPTVLAAATPQQQTLLLPASFFANRYVGASVTTVGAGNCQISIVAIGGLRSP
jgi:hypothetical protein